MATVYRNVREMGADGPEMDSGARRFRSIEAELNCALTFVTVAHLAFHFGETARGQRALLYAKEAHAEAKRMTAQFSSTHRNALLSKADELNSVMRELSPGARPFSSFVQQPSMS